MNPLRRLLAWLREQQPAPPRDDIERHLLHVGPLALQLTEQASLHVDVEEGLSLHVTEQRSLPDPAGRQLLLAARYAAACAADPLAPNRSFYDPATGAVHLDLSGEEGEFVGDVLAAYFRLTEEPDPRG